MILRSILSYIISKILCEPNKIILDLYSRSYERFLSYIISKILCVNLTRSYQIYIQDVMRVLMIQDRSYVNLTSSIFKIL